MDRCARRHIARIVGRERPRHRESPRFDQLPAQPHVRGRKLDVGAIDACGRATPGRTLAATREAGEARFENAKLDAATGLASTAVLTIWSWRSCPFWRWSGRGS